MNYTKLDDYAYFQDDSTTVESLFFNEQMIGVLDLTDSDDDKARAKQQIIEAIQKALTNLQQDEKNQPEGGFKVLVKSHHVQLREGLFRIASAAFPLALKLALMGPSGILVDVGTAAGGAALSMLGLVQRLDASELDTCAAVLRVIARKEPRVLVVHKASLQEIGAVFANDPELTKPHNLQETLNDLVAKKVLETEMVGGTRYYKIVF